MYYIRFFMDFSVIDFNQQRNAAILKKTALNAVIICSYMILKVNSFSYELKRPICFSTLFLAFIISSSNIYRNAVLFL